MVQTRSSGQKAEKIQVEQTAGRAQIKQKARVPQEPINEEQSHTVGKRIGVLRTTVDVQHHAKYEACRRLEVDIELEMPGEDPVEIGYLVGWLVDKTMMTPNGKAAWAMELLKQGKQGTRHKMEELRTSLHEVFRQDGSPRSKVADSQESLTMDKLVFIDTLVLEPEYRGTGLAQKAMQSFHNLVRRIIGPQVGAEVMLATMILSPAKSRDTKYENDKSAVEVERGLIKSYAKVGYEVWVHGNENKENTITVMGRTV